MLATPWPAPFDDPGWWFEPKWDGFRCLVDTRGPQPAFLSRRRVDLGARFEGLGRLRWPSGYVLDGEVVALADDRPSFSLLQQGKAVTYVAFDVLAGPDGDLTGLVLEERRARLEAAGLAPPIILSPVEHESGTALFSAARQRGFEGIVAKRLGSPYLPNRRSPDWRKVSFRRRLRAAVGGWLPSGRRRVRSLLIGLAVPGGLRFIGAVGSGLGDPEMGAFAEGLSALARDTSPFVAGTAGLPPGARWAEPGVTVVVEFKEWTRDLRLRAPVLVGVEPPGELPTWEEEGPDQADF